MLERFQSGKSLGRPWLGVSVVYVSGELAEAMKLPPDGGLLVQEIAQGSSAQTAGLRGPKRIVVIGNQEVGIGGDLIMEIDGRPMDASDSLRKALEKKHSGDSVLLTVFRDGKTLKVSVKLGEAPEERM
jgi:S1-C subfamily serine protease